MCVCVCVCMYVCMCVCALLASVPLAIVPEGCDMIDCYIYV